MRINAAPAYDVPSVSPFSSQGPASDGRIKPDVIAPGATIVAARSDGNTASAQCGPRPDRSAQSRRRCGRGEPSPGAVVAGATRAQSRRRCGRGEPSLGADVASFSTGQTSGSRSKPAPRSRRRWSRVPCCLCGSTSRQGPSVRLRTRSSHLPTARRFPCLSRCPSAAASHTAWYAAWQVLPLRRRARGRRAHAVRGSAQGDGRRLGAGTPATPVCTGPATDCAIPLTRGNGRLLAPPGSTGKRSRSGR